MVLHHLERRNLHRFKQEQNEPDVLKSDRNGSFFHYQSASEWIKFSDIHFPREFTHFINNVYVKLIRKKYILKVFEHHKEC